MTAVTLTLPFPPSLNALWRWVGGKVRLSHAAREYRHLGRKALEAQPWAAFPAEARLSVALKVCEPDSPGWRGADVDGWAKAVLDLLQLGGVISNDGQVDRLLTVRGERRGNGVVYVHISTLEPAKPVPAVPGNAVLDAVPKWNGTGHPGGVGHG